MDFLLIIKDQFYKEVKRAEDEGLVHEEDHAEVEYVLAHGIASRIEGKRILVGDNDATARNVAKRLGIEEYHSQALPERKTEIIKTLKNKGYVVAMVGDGINDSPAISYADVGISMKHGADIAKEACDILLLDRGLGGIIEAREIAQDAMSRIKKNFRYIIGINSTLIGLGILGMITPVTSAFMHNATTILVSANSLRPYRISPYWEREDNGLK